MPDPDDDVGFSVFGIVIQYNGSSRDYPILSIFSCVVKRYSQAASAYTKHLN